MKTKNNRTKSIFKSPNIHNTKKAQAAMEFMMTYGWAILIILIAGAALIYFDVLNPGKWLPDRCTIEGFACADFKVTNSSIALEISNSLGDDAIISNISVGEFSNNTPREILIGQQISILIDTSSGAGPGQPGKRFKREIRVKYTTTTSGISHTNTGELITEIEKEN